MGQFDWAVELAKEQIDLNGEDAVLKVFTTVVPDPNFPNEQGDSVETSANCRALFLNYSSGEAGRTYQDNTEIHRDDKKVLVAAEGLSTDPNLQGTLTRADGTIYRIKKIKCLDPAGQKIFFEIQARQ